MSHRLAVLAALVVFGACGGSPTEPGPPSSVVAVSVSGWLSPLVVGQSVQLTATALTPNGTTRVVTTEATWESSDATIAIVSPVGLVSAQGLGRVDIRARYQGQTGTLALTVEGNEPPPGPIPGLVCGTERWSVKTLSDPDASGVNLGLVQQTTIRALNDHASHCGGGPDRRTFGEEFDVYEVVGRVTFVRFEDDRDYHIAVADPSDPSYTIVTEVADIACQGALTSPHRATLELARSAFIDILGGRTPSSLVGTMLRLRGTGFFDFDHGQTGRSRNCMELHPIIRVERVQ